jgi:hypothetical protein
MVIYRVDFENNETAEVQENTHNSFESALVQAISPKFRGKVEVTNLQTFQVKFFKVSSPISRHFAASISEIIPGTKEYYS